MYMLNHKGTVVLETERLILRPFTLDDAAAAYYTWLKDEDVCRYMRWTAHKSLAESRQLIEDWVAMYSKPDFYIWVIELKETGKLVGSISIAVVNEHDDCMDTGYCLGKEYWGRGITTEALCAVIKFGIKEVGANRIEAYHSVNNPNSGKVMKKAGMSYEGTARQKYKANAGLQDSCVYAVLAQDILE